MAPVRQKAVHAANSTSQPLISGHALGPCRPSVPLDCLSYSIYLILVTHLISPRRLICHAQTTATRARYAEGSPSQTVPAAHANRRMQRLQQRCSNRCNSSTRLFDDAFASWLPACCSWPACYSADAAPLVVTLRQPASANDPRDTYPRPSSAWHWRRRSPPRPPHHPVLTTHERPACAGQREASLYPAF